MRINRILSAVAAAFMAIGIIAAQAAPALPPAPEDPAYEGYFAKPEFMPVPGPDGAGEARRFDITGGGGPNGDISGVLFPSPIEPGRYTVSIRARASAPGPVLRIGVSDGFMSAPLALSTDWQTFSETFDVNGETGRAGQWYREGNIDGGWIEVADFAVADADMGVAGVPTLPEFPENEAWQGYFSKPEFMPVDSPMGAGTGRRFDIGSGGSEAGDISGVWLPGSFPPGTYRVSISARVSAPGPTLQIGIDDSSMAQPMPVTTEWQEYSQTFVLDRPSNRAGQWLRDGNMAGGWMEVAGFKIETAGEQPAAPPPPVTAEGTPQFPENEVFQGYYAKPDFVAVDSPLGPGTGRRFDITSGGSDAGDVSGVWLGGALEPGYYSVSIRARASGSGPFLRIGVDDEYISAPLPLTTEWQEYTEVFNVEATTERSGEWFRQGNLPGGWIEVAGFSVTPMSEAEAMQAMAAADAAAEAAAMAADTARAEAEARAAAAKRAAAPARQASGCPRRTYFLTFPAESAYISGGARNRLIEIAEEAKRGKCRIIINGYSALGDRNRSRWARSRATAVGKVFSAAGVGNVSTSGQGATSQFGEPADNRRVMIMLRP